MTDVTIPPSAEKETIGSQPPDVDAAAARLVADQIRAVGKLPPRDPVEIAQRRQAAVMLEDLRRQRDEQRENAVIGELEQLLTPAPEPEPVEPEVVVIETSEERGTWQIFQPDFNPKKRRW